MEFHEKLQQLRKQKGLTQEALSQSLYVSRAAVSKWESGRGYPSIDSLKAIAKFYSVSVDDLLSGEEVLIIAEEDGKEKNRKFLALVLGLLDLSAVSFLFLPLFGQQTETEIQAVSLLSLTGTAPYLKTAFLVLTGAMILTGILALSLQNGNHAFRTRNQVKLSLLFQICGTLLFIIGSQPYAATLGFLFLGIKAFLLTKYP